MAGQVPHRSADACQHYQRFEADFDLAQSFGHNAHRFSIEWSRVEPQEGQWDEAAFEHYGQVIAALQARGIEPILTLHHFTNPVWFAARGGWANADSVALFRRYVDQVMTRFGSRVRYWITINEPTVYVKRAYVAGSWPPCAKGQWRLAARVLRNMCRAHREAYAVIHLRRPDAMVGIAHSAPHVEARNPANPANRLVAWLRNFVLNRWVFRMLRGQSLLTLDFIGINYYARELVRWHWRGLAPVFGVEDRESLAGEVRRFSSLGWEMHPPGLTAVLREFSRYRLPLLVTENGIATDDENLRSEYLQTHLAALAEAVGEGIDVRGYCYWSLMDNFEWAEGFNARFGLAAVDFQTQQRTPRPAATLYAQVCRDNAIRETASRR